MSVSELLHKFLKGKSDAAASAASVSPVADYGMWWSFYSNLLWHTCADKKIVMC